MKFFKWFIGIAFVACATALSFFNVAAAGMFLVASVMVALSSRAADLVEFAIGPLKAKLRERINEA
ncbi:hypothetical protein ACUOI1_26155, partial [Escherichia coli]